MKKLIIVILLLAGAHLLVAQEVQKVYGPIPESLFGSWVIEMPGEGEVPSQIFRWKFISKDDNQGECQFYWLFKRATDKEFITVGAFVFDFNVVNNEIYATLTKAGTQQIQGQGLQFHEGVVWYYPGDTYFDVIGRKEVVMEFELNDVHLILFEDSNGDWDFDDEGETQKYTREEAYKAIQI